MGQITDTADQLRHHGADITPVGDKDRRQRAQMQQHIEEFRHHRVDLQQVLGNGQMAGAGDGQKLCNTLYQTQQKGRKVCHKSHLMSY